MRPAGVATPRPTRPRCWSLTAAPSCTSGTPTALGPGRPLPRGVDDQVGAGPPGRPGRRRRSAGPGRPGSHHVPELGSQRLRRGAPSRPVRGHDDRGGLGRGPSRPDLASRLRDVLRRGGGDSRDLLPSAGRPAPPAPGTPTARPTRRCSTGSGSGRPAAPTTAALADLWRTLGCTADAVVGRRTRWRGGDGRRLPGRDRTDWARIGMLQIDGLRRTDPGAGTRAGSTASSPSRRTRSCDRDGCRAASPPTPASASTGGRSTTTAGGSPPTAAAASSPTSTATSRSSWSRRPSGPTTTSWSTGSAATSATSPCPAIAPQQPHPCARDRDLRRSTTHETG